MLKTILRSKVKDKKNKEKSLLMLELAEIEEIADMIFKKMDKKIKLFEALEASVDKRIATFERLIQRAESIKIPSAGLDRQHEIIALTERGLRIDEIADILDMPVGEADLILNLYSHKS